MLLVVLYVTNKDIFLKTFVNHIVNLHIIYPNIFRYVGAYCTIITINPNLLIDSITFETTINPDTVLLGPRF